MPINENELKEAIDRVCSALEVKGHILIYLDGDKLKFTGNLSVSALAPLLMEWLTKKK